MDKIEETEETRAILTIHRADDMNFFEARELAEWLRDQATWLVANHDKLSRRYSARLYQACRFPSLDEAKPHPR